MTEEQGSADARVMFQQLLNTAITLGGMPPADARLGPDTLAAIGLVAREHPEAPADLIASAYDAFGREHG